MTGPHLVCAAARAGLTAAHHMGRYFTGEPWEALAAPPVVSTSQA